jgi:transposase
MRCRGHGHSPFNLEATDNMTTNQFHRFLGIDWATQSHEATLVAPDGEILATRPIEHSGSGISSFIDWLLSLGEAEHTAIAIETPRGALVEMLLERGFAVHTINPKQLDRFRDRHTVAGAKDDSLDSYVLGDSLRTDLHLFRRLQLEDAEIIELREFSRIAEELKTERGRLANRLREQIYRHFPQLLSLCPAADEAWFWELVQLVPTPAKARTIKAAQIGRVLRQHRIRRFKTKDLLEVLRTKPVRVAPGTTEAATSHIQLLLPRLRLVQQQIRSTEERIKTILEQLSTPESDDQGQQQEHRDAAIILSVPGIGITTTATMLSEAAQALADRNYSQLRAACGVAPVTRRSGRSKIVLRRYACNSRLTQAIYHAARVHAQCDPGARARYAELRQRGHSHGRALRTIGDRLLAVLVAMLRTGTLYDAGRRGRSQPAPELAA